MVQNTNPDEETGGINADAPNSEFEPVAAEEIGAESTIPEEEKPLPFLAIWDALGDLYPPNAQGEKISPEERLQLTLLLPQHSRYLAKLLLLRHQVDYKRISRDEAARARNIGKIIPGINVDDILYTRLNLLQSHFIAPKIGTAESRRQFLTHIKLADVKNRTADETIPLEKILENPEKFLRRIDDQNSFGFRTQPENRLVYKYDDKVRTEYDGKTYRVHYKKSLFGESKVNYKDRKWTQSNPLKEGLSHHNRMILLQLRSDGHQTFSFNGRCSRRYVESMLEESKRVRGIRLNVASLANVGLSEKDLKKIEKKYGLTIPRPEPDPDQEPIQLGRDSFFKRATRRNVRANFMRSRGKVKVWPATKDGYKTAMLRKNRGYVGLASMAVVTGMMVAANPGLPPDTGCEPYRDPLTKIIDGTKSAWESLKKELETDPTRNVKSYEYYREAKNAGKHVDDPDYLHDPNKPQQTVTPSNSSASVSSVESRRADWNTEVARYQEAMASMTKAPVKKEPVKKIYGANKVELAGQAMAPGAPRNELRV